MRRMMAGAISVFIVFFAAIPTLGGASAWVLFGGLSLGSLRGVVLLLGAVVATYAWAVVFFRVFFFFNPMPQGVVVPGSRDQFVSDVYVLFQLFLLHPLLRNPAVPVPLMRLILPALGARMGRNSFSAGIVQDPLLTEMGDNSLVGESAVVLAHAIEGDRLTYSRVRIGSYVTVGVRAIIMPGVTIGDGAIVAANSVVPEGARIGRNEVWGGVPARKIKEVGSLAPPEYAVAMTALPVGVTGVSATPAN